MKKYLFWIICALQTILCVNFAVSQDWLKEFSTQRTIQWENERAFAESIAVLKNMPIRVDRPDGTTFELQRFYNGKPLYAKTDNSNAAKTISTNKVYPGAGYGYSLTGDGILLGEWDAGRVRTSHQEFGGRVTSTQGSNNFHSTHVAGTMIAAGIQAAARGMSYEASLNAFDWNNVDAEMATQANGGLQVSSHSWGWITGWEFDYRGDGLWAWFGDPSISTTQDWSFGFYDDQARTWDNISQNAPNFLIVRAAQNDRGDGPNGSVEHWVWVSSSWVKQTVARNKDGNTFGYDCLSGAGVAKNVLTVGAVQDIPSGYSGPGSVVMSSFSCWGPTDDGRIKPDVVANGISLYSSLETSDNAYGTLSGTSMATPNVSGSVGLILEYQKNLHGSSALRSATVKALIINTADEAGSYNGPDYIYGWGLMNTFKAIGLMQKDSASGFDTHIHELLLNRYDTIKINIGSDGLEPLKATICWTDAPGTSPSPSLNPTTRMLVNDLDLRIIKKRDNQTYSPWTLNPASPSAAATSGDNIRDNVEQVYIASPEATSYTLQITHKGTLSSLSQNVSLVISGNVKILGPVFVTNKDTFEYTHIPEGNIRDSLKIRNHGDSLLILKPYVPDSIQSWLAFDEDSITVDPLDSIFIHFTVSTDDFTPWKTYLGTIDLNCNDSTVTPFPLTIIHHTLGPTLIAAPQHFVIDVDTNQTKSDSIKIRNDGYIPLHFSIIDTGSAIPQWLTLHVDTGAIAVSDSMYIPFTVNDPSQNIGDYYTTVQFESNDFQSGIVDILIDMHVGTNRTITVTVHDHWNIVSLPVIPEIKLKTELFPTAISDAYAYEDVYITKDTLVEGTGYWIKFAGEQPVTFQGYVFHSDTIDVLEGWNLIGTISNTIPVTSAASIPPDIMNSYFFEYDKGYVIADSLHPGRGYWIQATQPGTIIFNGEFPPISKTTSDPILSPLSSITITENALLSQVLYFGSAMITGAGKFTLPPCSPNDFDARFSDGTMAAICNPIGNAEYPITIHSTSATLSLRWDVKATDAGIYKIRNENGTMIPLIGNGELLMAMNPSGTTILKLVATTENMPKEFALHQNYPNPFNPTTRIEFDMPSSGPVSIKLYNLLGSEVMTLFNGFREAGYHAITVDASDIPSGIYFCKMVSDKFTAVRKLVLTK